MAFAPICSSAEDRALGGAAARIAYPSGPVADDQHHLVAGVLEGPQLLKLHAVPEVDVGRGGVDPQLHAQRPPLGELLGKAPLGQGLHGPPQQGVSAAASPSGELIAGMLDAGPVGPAPGARHAYEEL